VRPNRHMRDVAAAIAAILVGAVTLLGLQFLIF
jgi:hypothetical protein